MNTGSNILRYILVLFAICLPALSSLAQEIRTTAPDEVLENEAFQIQYDIVHNVPIQDMPNLVDSKDFELVSNPELKRLYPSPFWGNTYYTLRLIFTFKPKKAGTLNIPRIELSIDGNKLSSKKGKILVRDLPEMGDVKYFVKAFVTKKQINVGDTLTLTYKLYSTKDVSNILGIELPKLKDFYYQDLSPRRASFTEENIDGVAYKVYVIRQYVLQSRSLGTKELPEGNMEIEYTYPTGRTRSDQWGRTYDEQLRETKMCAIESIKIFVHDMIAI